MDKSTGNKELFVNRVGNNTAPNWLIRGREDELFTCITLAVNRLNWKSLSRCARIYPLWPLCSRLFLCGFGLQRTFWNLGFASSPICSFDYWHFDRLDGFYYLLCVQMHFSQKHHQLHWALHGSVNCKRWLHTNTFLINTRNKKPDRPTLDGQKPGKCKPENKIKGIIELIEQSTG